MGKKIVITGVSRGLGYSLAEKLVVDGHDVAGCSRRGEGPNLLKLCSAVDVREVNAVNAFAESVMSVFGGAPDILINNAAIMNTPAKLWEVPSDEFKTLMDINVVGMVNMIRAFYPAMAESGGGVIVNMSSAWGRATSPNVAPYCASKYAVEGLSQAMAEEVSAGMAVVSLNPGFIDTDMVKGVFGSANGAEGVEQWAERAAPFVLKLHSGDNGRQLTVL